MVAVMMMTMAVLIVTMMLCDQIDAGNCSENDDDHYSSDDDVDNGDEDEDDADNGGEDDDAKDDKEGKKRARITRGRKTVQNAGVETLGVYPRLAMTTIRSIHIPSFTKYAPDCSHSNICMWHPLAPIGNIGHPFSIGR